MRCILATGTFPRGLVVFGASLTLGTPTTGSMDQPKYQRDSLPQNGPATPTGSREVSGLIVLIF